jgi:hypothetical protein
MTETENKKPTHFVLAVSEAELRQVIGLALNFGDFTLAPELHMRAFGEELTWTFPSPTRDGGQK